ncbi:hypothetical protein RRF57_012033 [Xylaria bambusicola]|uniref:JmjC domain-containing protein n=1 Tax=Xylaria bambusicola TaxID=326684 RepID=A0AAN7ZDF1_9PEZI
MRRVSAYRAFQASRSRPGHLQVRRYATPVPDDHLNHHDRVRPVATIDGAADVEAFRSLAWGPAMPVHWKGFHQLPAMKSWTTVRGREKGLVSFGGDKLESFSDTIVSYELIVSPSSQGDESSGCSLDCLKAFQAWLDRTLTNQHNHLLQNLTSQLLESAENSRSRFLQFDAPLSLIIQASRYNRSKGIDPWQRVSQLYIAQSDIRNLPPALGDDLPVPDIVGRVGKGDIYDSSIWLGLQPTYTPLHRDPNPNLFCQLVGSKAVRLLRPKAGLSVFADVLRSLGAVGNSRFRGPEMMDGPEREGLHRAVWGDPDPSREVLQATLGPGDALFIPRGWWHSVRSVGHEAELNASANWWFR